MGKYNFQAIEKKWQQYWKANRSLNKSDNSTRPKYYVLDMFPYPSGAGLHVGHPLGYIATDIVARFKRLKGYNVLHPMGFDAFGLPAENYAIQTGVHPAISTEKNITRFKEQLETLGLMYDTNAELRTCDPEYYKWTQWIFLQLFNSWYNKTTNRAEAIDTLIPLLQANGSNVEAVRSTKATTFAADEWDKFTEKEKQQILLEYRLAYISYDYVNWCPALGTVLANEEVKDGYSERGGHPVERRQMRQWSLRITAYAERLLNDLETIDWHTSIVEMQRNWIGKSTGATIHFAIKGSAAKLEIFTTRPDTLFGVSFMVVAPEHTMVQELTTPEQAKEVATYLDAVKGRSERERQAEVKRVTGCFTGSYTIHPFTGKEIPIYISDYVLVGYGTGAIMAVPAHDGRDYNFAKHFQLPILEVVAGGDITEAAYETKDGTLVNSDFINGMTVPAAIAAVNKRLEEQGLGKARTNYRLRDSIFSRQRYWGEPFPIVFDGDIPVALPESELPVVLPPVSSYKPTGDGDSPLATVSDWVNMPNGTQRETNTMPGWAGSSWYFFRYADNQNTGAFADKDKTTHLLPVDLYVGGAEHAVGHLLYARFWTKFLYDKGYVTVTEPFKKLVNQGMIQGRSSLAYKRKDSNTFTAWQLIQNQFKSQTAIPKIEDYIHQSYIPIHVDVNIVTDDILDIAAFKAFIPDYENAVFELNDNGTFDCNYQIEKMSKSLHNVVNPEILADQYGADTFRLYEMFLGPLEQHKPWNTQGISGVFSCLRKLYNLYIDDNEQLALTDEAPTPAELKILHQTIKKVEEDIDKLSFNTCVPQFMIFTNKMVELNCKKRAILEPFLVVLSSFAPHFSEELWQQLGHNDSILEASYPAFNAAYLVEDSFEYPVSINGKLRANVTLPLDLPQAEAEAAALAQENVQRHLNGATPKKIVFVKGKIINIVI